jgi:RND family efflux transporter MFP subunit
MKRFRSWMILAVLILAGAAWWEFARRPVTAAEPVASVLVNTIKLTAGPGAETTMAMQASGVVSDIAVSVGQQVTAGQVLASVAADAQSVADVRKAQDALAAAKAARAHVAALLAGHLATNADLAAADQAVGDADGALAALQAMGAGKARSIVAPFAGIVSAVLVAPGTVQPGGTALLRLIETGRLVVVAGVPPAQAGGIAPGEAAKLTLLNEGTQVDGKVVRMAAMPDPQSGLEDVTVAPPGALPLGEPVEAVITTGGTDGYVVPRDAVQNDAQNIAHRVGVHVLGNTGARTVLAPGGLNAAMPLVTTGAYQLDDGVAVRMNGAAN